ncbi:MAG: NAD(P)/FAD-dependent oxidoreductase [Lachnospiraceae bacterium]
MIRINEIKLPVEHEKKDLEEKIREKLGLKETPQFSIKRRSIDARKKENLCYSYTVDISMPKKWEERFLRRKRRGISKINQIIYHFPYTANEISKEKKRPVIIGTGPAGLYCGLMLAKAGYKPILLERGKAMEERVEAVEAFWSGKKLLPNCNVQFGEGGAGTFSDGKLNTTVNDKSGRNDEVLRQFVAHGAKEEILYDGKPHIGTDCLRDIIINMRNTIKKLGGEIRFSHKVISVEDHHTGVLKGLWIDAEREGKYFLECDMAVLAPGHSARDTFFMLHDKKIVMESKAFAMGVRVEHKREMINRSQYGESEQAKLLETAPYKVTARTKKGRNVYSFCMCPGGFVVNASSQDGYLAINGMSNSDRMANNSNAAIVVNVTQEDYGSLHPLSGVFFQQKWEKKAYEICGGKIPVQRLEDFKKNQVSKSFGEVKPSMKGEFSFGNVRECLPDYICEAIEEGMEKFDSQISGYANNDTLISGIESRTSSPLRIVRDKNFESSMKGLFPCGEGAGYAGGITSAAIDGIRVAEEVARRLNERG